MVIINHGYFPIRWTTFNLPAFPCPLVSQSVAQFASQAAAAAAAVAALPHYHSNWRWHIVFWNAEMRLPDLAPGATTSDYGDDRSLNFPTALFLLFIIVLFCSAFHFLFFHCAFTFIFCCYCRYHCALFSSAGLVHTHTLISAQICTISSSQPGTFCFSESVRLSDCAISN